MHQLPPKPDYFRVKIWRRLQRMGAVAIKSSVYALPRTDQTAEQFQWILREIVAGGGEGSVCEAAFVDGLSDTQVEAIFRGAREADYAALVEEIDDLMRRAPAGRARESPQGADLEVATARLRRRLGEIMAIDFLAAPARRSAVLALETLEARLRPAEPTARRPRAPFTGTKRKANQMWVTRRGVHVDRIASAWLIRRFIDKKARFRFVEEGRGEYHPRTGEVRFDMFQGDYTHEGDRCTFETLLGRFGLERPGLRMIAEIVHDIDLRDGKFGRPETAGLERLINGIARRYPSDEDRIERGMAVLDDFFEAFEN
jgi:hypothetical protein